MVTFEKKINEVFDIAVYLQLMGAFVPNADFSEIKEIVIGIYEFLKNSPRKEVELKLPQLKDTLENMAKLFIEKFPPKRSISEIASDWNSLFKGGYDVFSNGVTYGWLSKQMDLKNLNLYDYLPYHFKIGLVAHKGYGGVEEEFLLKDSFNSLVRAEYYINILNIYGEKAKKIESEQNEFKKETYEQIAELKYEVAAFSRLTIVSFFSFVESFVNSVGYSYLQYNFDRLSDSEKEILTGLKKGRFLQLQSKIGKYQMIIRPDKKSVLQITDENQIQEPFKSFFDYFEDLRNSSVHFSPTKEKIWMSPQDWLEKAKIFSRLAVNVGSEFWKACYPDSEGPQYVGQLDYDLHYKAALTRHTNILRIESEFK